MFFPRHRKLIRISIVISEIFAVLSLILGFLLGIVFAASTKNAILFVIYFFGGLGIALVLFIDIRIQKWLELDFEELDNALNSTDRKIEKAKSSAVTRFVDKDTGREITTLSGDPNGKFIVGDNVVTLKPHRDMFGRIIPPNTAGKVVKVYASKVDVLFKIDSVNTTVQFNKDEVIKRFY